MTYAGFPQGFLGTFLWTDGSCVYRSWSKFIGLGVRHNRRKNTPETDSLIGGCLENSILRSSTMYTILKRRSDTRRILILCYCSTHERHAQ